MSRVKFALKVDPMALAHASEAAHISVCVCTYKRPHLLKRLLKELLRQDTGGLFSYSIVVADNDEARSAEATVSEVSASTAKCRIELLRRTKTQHCTGTQQGGSKCRGRVSRIY